MIFVVCLLTAALVAQSWVLSSFFVAMHRDSLSHIEKTQQVGGHPAALELEKLQIHQTQIESEAEHKREMLRARMSAAQASDYEPRNGRMKSADELMG